MANANSVTQIDARLTWFNAADIHQVRSDDGHVALHFGAVAPVDQLAAASRHAPGHCPLNHALHGALGHAADVREVALCAAVLRAQRHARGVPIPVLGQACLPMQGGMRMQVPACMAMPLGMQLQLRMSARIRAHARARSGLAAARATAGGGPCSAQQPPGGGGRHRCRRAPAWGRRPEPAWDCLPHTSNPPVSNAAHGYPDGCHFYACMDNSIGAIRQRTEFKSSLSAPHAKSLHVMQLPTEQMKGPSSHTTNLPCVREGRAIAKANPRVLDGPLLNNEARKQLLSPPAAILFQREDQLCRLLTAVLSSLLSSCTSVVLVRHPIATNSCMVSNKTTAIQETKSTSWRYHQ